MLSVKPKEFFFLFFFLFFLGNTKSEDFKRKEITGLTSREFFLLPGIAPDIFGLVQMRGSIGLMV